MIYSRYLVPVSDSHRVSRSPFRWLSDLARRTFPFSPAGQEPYKRLGFYRGKHSAGTANLWPAFLISMFCLLVILIDGLVSL